MSRRARPAAPRAETRASSVAPGRSDLAESLGPSFVIAVDVVTLSVLDRTLVALLVARDDAPHRGRWSLPSGYLEVDEPLPRAAARVLAREGGLRDVYLEQLFTFTAPARDPRPRTLSVAYCALIAPQRFREAARAKPGVCVACLRIPWAGEEGGPVRAETSEGQALPLAFDHAEIMGAAVKRLRGKLAYSPVGFALLAPTFTLRELQDVHEAILGRKLNKDSFRRRVRASAQIEATGQRQDAVGHRPAQLFRFRPVEVAAYLAGDLG